MLWHIHCFDVKDFYGFSVVQRYPAHTLPTAIEVIRGGECLLFTVCENLTIYGNKNGIYRMQELGQYVGLFCKIFVFFL